MSVGVTLERLIALARRSDGPKPEAPASQIETLRGALTALAAERAGAEASIATASEKRETLLLQPASDTAIDGLDREISLAQRKIERCDKIEPLLLQQIGTFRDVLRERKFDALVKLYAESIKRYASTLRQLLAIKDEIAALRAVGDEEGFRELQLFFSVPYLQCSDPDRFEFSALAEVERLHRSEPESTTAVVFKQACGIYRSGEVAGFSEDIARRYVEAGVAMLAPAAPASH